MQERSTYATCAEEKSIKARNTIGTNLYDGCFYEWVEHEECHQVSAELDMDSVCDIDDGLSSDDFGAAINNYIYQEHYNDITDDIAEDWQNLTRYEKVCKILEELKIKEVNNENN